MPDKPPSLKQKPKPWRGRPGFEHWGEITKPPAFKEGLGRKVGGWLVGLLTAWKR